MHTKHAFRIKLIIKLTLFYVVAVSLMSGLIEENWILIICLCIYLIVIYHLAEVYEESLISQGYVVRKERSI